MALSLPTVEDPRTQQALNAIAGSFPLTTNLLVNEIITVDKIAEGTITGAKIAAGTIEGSNIVAGTIEGTHIKAGSITAEKLSVAELSAITANLGTVTAGKLEAVTVKGSTVEGTTIKGSTIEGTTIKGGTVEGTTVKGGTVEGVTVKASTVEGTTIKGGTLEGTTVKGGTIEGGEIIGATIKTAAAGARVEMDSTGIRGINAAAVKKFEFATATGILTATAVISAEEGSVIPTKVLSGQIKETQIEEGAISTPLLAANAITTAKLAANSVTSEKIVAGTIEGGDIKAGTITAEKLNIGTLSAITADLGTVTAGTIESVSIKSVTLTSSTIQLPVATGEEVLTGGKTISWLDGAKVRGIVGITGTVSASSVYVMANSPYAEPAEANRTLQGVAVLRAYSKESKIAGIRLSSQGLIQTVKAEADAKNPLVINSSGESSYPQLTEIAGRTIDLKGGNVTLRGTGDVSDFPQLPETLKRRIVYGTVTSAGAKSTGEGFTVKKNSTGNYTVTFSSEMTITPACTASPNTTSIIPQHTVANISKTSFDFRIWNGGVLSDQAWSFIAIG